MRIVSRKEFMSLPNGTVYAEYAPCHFGEILVKRDSVRGVDFHYSETIPWPAGVTNCIEWIDTLGKMKETGEDIPLDFDCEQRDGMFNNEQLYAVFSRQDVLGICAMLLGDK